MNTIEWIGDLPEHEELIQIYREKQTLNAEELSRMMRVWQSPMTSMLLDDFEIAYALAHLLPFQDNWQNDFQEGDQVELLLPEYQYQLPVYWQGERIKGTVLQISDDPDSKRPIRVRFDVRAMELPLPEFWTETAKRLTGKDVSTNYTTLSVWVSPAWIFKDDD